MSCRYPDARILIFAKAPVVGTVKTRLIGTLSAQQAADIHHLMLDYTVNMALASKLAPITLYCSPDTSNKVFQGYKHQGVELRIQHGDDLGCRMANALTETLNDEKKAVLIGSDSPVMDGQYLDAALMSLTKYETVIGPAEDGGYVLVGQNKINEQIFKNINWGTADVLRQTRQHLQDININWFELDTLWDVDRPDDLQRKEMRALMDNVSLD